jgi:hypothetical protein
VESQLRLYPGEHGAGLAPGRHFVRVELRDAFPSLSADESLLAVRSQMLDVKLGAAGVAGAAEELVTGEGGAGGRGQEVVEIGKRPSRTAVCVSGQIRSLNLSPLSPGWPKTDSNQVFTQILLHLLLLPPPTSSSSFLLLRRGSVVSMC